MPRVFGTSGAPEYSGSRQHHLQSISRRAKDGWTTSSNTRHHRLDDLEVTNDSQDPVVSGRGIMMKTDIHLDVCDSQPNGDDEDNTHQTCHAAQIVVNKLIFKLLCSYRRENQA